MFYNAKLNQQIVRIMDNERKINNLVEQLNIYIKKNEKNKDLFVKALNEQREKISKIIIIINYVCKKLNIKVINKSKKD